jgi:hypothetical protein
MHRAICRFAPLACASAVVAAPWPTDHPRAKFPANETAIRAFKGKSEAELAALHRVATRSHTHKSSFEQPLSNAVGLWQKGGDDGRRKLAIMACRAALATWTGKTDDELRSSINELGPRDETNIVARDAAYHLALLYHLTGETSYADKAEVLLARFAAVIPGWKVYRTHYGEEYLKHVHDQNSEGISRHWDAAGLWGTWIYLDPGAARPLAYAYDLIHDAGLMQERGSLAGIEHMLRLHVQLQVRYGRNLGNMDGSAMRGILDLAYLLGEPQWVHDCEDWISDIYQTMFYADGWWHEGTPSYHKQLHHNLKGLVGNWLMGYTDPPGFVAVDGTRFDNFKPGLVLQRRMARADQAMNSCVQPDRTAQVIHDTWFRQPAWWVAPMTEAKSHLYGSFGHAILGTGKGDDMVQVSLHFSGTHGHEHSDALNIILFAKGYELFSETQYRASGFEDQCPRPWLASTAGHNTVVIDERDQPARNAPGFQSGVQERERQPEDAVEGVPDSPWRWMGHGNSMNDGKLRLYNTDFAMVQVVEAEAERANVPMPRQFRRTIALVKIDEHDTYTVDIFRVRGGTLHDYMLHGCLNEPYTAETSVDVVEPMDGVLHEYIRDLRTVQTDDGWQVTMRLDNGKAATRTWMLAQPGTRIIQGRAPAMRRKGSAPFVAVRQSDGASTFVAVHHAFTGDPIVQRVELIEAGDARVSLRVLLPNGSDTITSTDTGFTHERSGQWQYEVGGKHTFAGTLKRTHRVEAGDASDAFITDTPLPTDGSLDGFALMVDQGGLLVQSFTIDHVERHDGETFVVSRDEPGMRISDGFIKQMYYPCWGIKGKARFRIAGAKLQR